MNRSRRIGHEADEPIVCQQSLERVDSGRHRRSLGRARRGRVRAAEAGISQTGLLYHFPSKEALLNAVMDRHLTFSEEWLWGHDPDPGPAGTELHPRLVNGYRTTIDRVAATLRSAQERGDMRPDIDPRLKAMEIIAFCYGLEAAWLVDPSIPVAEAAAQWAAQQTAQMSPS
ncbi:TetR family transcriptional regulator [Kribbella sp. NPDC048915]|uniref:TetR family transcriptional regulator n=1 Tax=Kribbella sp. NPDC048915 TaxID=3155148 RepID=UPI00340D18A9